MTIDFQILGRNLDPDRTVLLLGAGSSMPSGGMSGPEMAHSIAREFRIEYDQATSLSDVATIVEKRRGRPELIAFIRRLLKGLHPTGSMLNLPLFEWQSIYTTNYDTLVEDAYKRARRDIVVYKSNFDFSVRGHEGAAKLFNIHGSIEDDVVDGKLSRIIVSHKDYELATEYRELLYGSLQQEISSGNLLIIGHSLGDLDLKLLVDDALRLKKTAGAPGRIYLLAYTGSEDRALIYEDRGIDVCLGGLDELIDALNAKLPQVQLALSSSGDPLVDRI